MPSPNQVSNPALFEHVIVTPYDGVGEKNKTIRDIIGDDLVMEERIKELSKSEDDPPILFEWNFQALEEFWTKAVALGIAPPVEINGGVPPIGVANVGQLQHDILVFVKSLVPSQPAMIGQTLGLACSLNQSLTVVSLLALMKTNQPWFAAVLAQDAPLTSPLASLYHPRPRVSSGICDPILFDGTLWT